MKCICYVAFDCPSNQLEGTGSPEGLSCGRIDAPSGSLQREDRVLQNIQHIHELTTKNILLGQRTEDYNLKHTFQLFLLVLVHWSMQHCVQEPHSWEWCRIRPQFSTRSLKGLEQICQGKSWANISSSKTCLALVTLALHDCTAVYVSHRHWSERSSSVTADLGLAKVSWIITYFKHKNILALLTQSSIFACYGNECCKPSGRVIWYGASPEAPFWTWTSHD